jgi:predicted 3-demethylubiquinone-9 3-methyltransferase (glyoxalase superfamily)
MQKITPFLWFDGRAEEAVNFYVSVFRNSRVVSLTRGPDGAAFHATFQLEGQNFQALNGGPKYEFTEAVSLYVDCADQAEVDALWEKLSAGGEIQMCGWLKDKFGLSWQIIPAALGRLMSDKDPAKAGRVMQAMLQMKKLDVATLQQAYEGR